MPAANPRSIAAAAARRYGVPVDLYLKQMGMESGYRASARSPANAYGWVQIHLPSHPEITEAQARDPHFAFNWGAKQMRQLYDQFGRWDYALAAYNAGAGAVKKYGGIPPYAETQRYVSRIMKAFNGDTKTAPRAQPNRSSPAFPIVELPKPPDLTEFAFNLMNHVGNPTDNLRNLALTVAMSKQQSPSLAQMEQPQQQQRAPTYQGPGQVTLASGADRAGVRTGAGILDFARKVSGYYGNPLKITTGTRHSQMTVNGRQSAHWTGRAADIAASGDQLTKMGRAALVAAGMDPKQAAKQKGGLFNIGGYQIIFNTRQGGNHWNHLHIGLRG